MHTAWGSRGPTPGVLSWRYNRYLKMGLLRDDGRSWLWINMPPLILGLSISAYFDWLIWTAKMGQLKLIRQFPVRLSIDLNHNHHLYSHSRESS